MIMYTMIFIVNLSLFIQLHVFDLTPFIHFQVFVLTSKLTCVISLALFNLFSETFLCVLLEIISTYSLNKYLLILMQTAEWIMDYVS